MGLRLEGLGSQSVQLRPKLQGSVLFALGFPPTGAWRQLKSLPLCGSALPKLPDLWK